MKNNEINELLARLNQTAADLENAYIESEGEVTEWTESVESELDYLKELLTTEGVDSLGRWLKAKEDRKKTLKAEKDYIARQINATDDTIAFIKAQIAKILVMTGTDKVKGLNGYSFSATTSTTTEVRKDVLDECFKDKVAEAVRDILPADVTFTLKASVSAVPEGAELPSYYNQTVAPSVRFSKPRASREEA